MLKSLNRSEFADALREGFDTDLLTLALSEDVIPTATVYDSTDSPYHHFGKLIKRTITASAAPAATKFGYTWCSPNRDTALQVLGYRVSNNADAAYLFNEKIFTKANLDALGAHSNDDNFYYVSNLKAGVQSPCTLAAADATANLGATLDNYSITNGTNSGIVLFPKPGIVLFGNDPGGIPGWGFRIGTAEKGPYTLAVIAREWPLKTVGQ